MAEVDYSQPSWQRFDPVERIGEMRDRMLRNQQQQFERGIQEQTQRRLQEAQNADLAEQRQRVQKAARDFQNQQDFKKAIAGIDQSAPDLNNQVMRAYMTTFGSLPAGALTQLEKPLPKPATTPPPDWMTGGGLPVNMFPEPLLIPRPTSFQSPIRPSLGPLPTPAPQLAPAGTGIQPMVWNGRELVPNPAYTKPGTEQSLDLRRKAEADRVANEAAILSQRGEFHKDTEADKAADLKQKRELAQAAATRMILTTQRSGLVKELANLSKTTASEYAMDRIISGEIKPEDKNTAIAEYAQKVKDLEKGLTDIDAELKDIGEGAMPAATSKPAVTGKKWVYDTKTNALVPAP